MKPGRIRPLALCVFRHRDRIFVSEGYDLLKGEHFYRPIGGGIEFGEEGKQAAAREVREELGAEITNLRYLGLSENIFTYNGQPGHEIVLLYQADFVDQAFYEQEWVYGHEEGDEDFKVIWQPLSLFQQGVLLYPNGLLEMLLGV